MANSGPGEPKMLVEGTTMIGREPEKCKLTKGTKIPMSSAILSWTLGPKISSSAKRFEIVKLLSRNNSILG